MPNYGKDLEQQRSGIQRVSWRRKEERRSSGGAWLGHNEQQVFEEHH